MAGTTQWTTALAMIARLAKPEDKEYWLGINTSLFGLGLMAGPLISSALFAVLGYKMMFFVYGGAEIILAVIIRLCLLDPVIEDQKHKEGQNEGKSSTVPLRAS